MSRQEHAVWGRRLLHDAGFLKPWPVGAYEYAWSPDREDGRRCLIGDELLELGMELDPRGRWRIALTDEKRSELAALHSPRSKTVGAGRATTS